MTADASTHARKRDLPDIEQAPVPARSAGARLPRVPLDLDPDLDPDPDLNLDLDLNLDPELDLRPDPDLRM